MAVGLFLIGAQPAVGYLFPGTWHYVVHFVTFAVFGAVWTLGLPNTPALWIAAGTVAFGLMHEAYEIVGHVHGFELVDAVIDGIGAIVGTTFASVCLARVGQKS